jgi:hypothetical protein
VTGELEEEGETEAERVIEIVGVMEREGVAEAVTLVE